MTQFQNCIIFSRNKLKQNLTTWRLTTEIRHTKTNNKSSIKYQLKGQGEKIELFRFLPGNG